MKPEELRIGNWVDFDGDHAIVTASDFTDKLFLRKIKPIPLNDHWLEAFGFKYDKLFERWEDPGNNGVFIEKDSEGNYVFELYYCYMIVKHVHQLQNLYHALSGKELI